MDPVTQFAAPIATTVGTGISVAWIAKVMFQRWLTRQEKDSEILRDMDKQLTVALHRLDRIERDINNLGQSMRERLRRIEEDVPCGTAAS